MAGTTQTVSFTLVPDTTPPVVSLECGGNTAYTIDNDLLLELDTEREQPVTLHISEPFIQNDWYFAVTNSLTGSLVLKQEDGHGGWEVNYTPDLDQAGVESTVTVPAGVVEDEAGNLNAASEPLHIAWGRSVSVANASAEEGNGTTIDFEVTLDARNDCRTATVDWATADGTATAGDDYTAASGTVAFGPGETSKTVRVVVLDDTQSDSGETFTLQLSNASGATLDVTEATGTIMDDDPEQTLRQQVVSDTEVPSVTLASETSLVTDTIGNRNRFDVTVTFSEPVSGFDMSELEVTNGSAREMSTNSDSTQYTVTIDPGEVTGEVRVKVPAGVATDEDGNLNTASAVIGIWSIGAADWSTDRPSATLRCDRSTPREHGSGWSGFNVDALFNRIVTGFELGDIELSHPPGFSPNKGMATDGSGSSDWFNVGVGRDHYSESVQVTIKIPADVAEDQSGNLNTASETLRIGLNPRVSVKDAGAVEGTGATMDFEVTLNIVDDCETVTVDWATADGTATAGQDYIAASGTLTFRPGETSKTVSIAVLDDSDTDDDETVTLRLSNASGVTIDDAEAMGTIADDEAQEQSASDTEPPTVAVTSEATAPVSGEFDVKVTFSEPTTGFAMSDLQIVIGTAVRMLSEPNGTGHVVTIAPDPNVRGTLTVSVPAGVATDAADNPNTASEVFEIEVNSDPTGLPTISGTARVGATLTASASGIADADGLTGATFSWQWIANDGTADADISGATGATYTLTPAEAGKMIKVRVTFTDDGGTEETLESEATAAVEAGLTARFENVPASHDGSSAFRLRLAFSEEVFEGSEPFDKNQAIQDALVVSGGAVTGRARVDKDEFDEWWIKVAPSGNGAVTVSLPAQTDCEAAGAVCTPNGAALASPVSATVPGPVSQTREVSIAAANSSTTRNVTADSSQVTEGTAAEFTLTRTGPLADALTVNVTVTETGTMLSGTVPETVTFNANSPTAELRIETEDDEVAEPASTITAALAAGSGYAMDTGAASASATVEDDDAAPVVQTAAIVTVPENTTAVATLTATDDDTPVADLGWSIAGGADAAMFTVSAGGDLAFASAKDFEAPDDADTDGDYEVTVRVTDGANADDAALTVRLADVDDVSPVLTDANVDGDALTLTFGEPLDGSSVPAPSAFSATVDGAARGISDVSMSGSSVTLTLASAVVSGETVTVGYAVPTGANARPLRDAAENAVAGFSNRAVTNTTPASNAAPVGLPTVSGTAQVGETLTASSAGITDTDGLTNATYAWQWIADDGTSDTDISGATGATYTLTAAEAGKTIKVRVTFTDDGGTEETLESEATAAVEAGLTARFENMPAEHDGESWFEFEVSFSEAFKLSYRTLRDRAFRVTNGRVTRASRIDNKHHEPNGLKPNRRWLVRVRPDSAAQDVTIVLPATIDCGASGAVCTPDGAALASPVSATVPGPVSQTREVSIAAANSSTTRNVTADSSQVTEGTAAEFTLTRTGPLADALTVNVTVTETGTMLSGTVPETVTFNANSPTAELRIETEDDEVAEPASTITAALAAGSGYAMDSGAALASVTVEDDDAAPVVQTAAIVTVPENTTAVATLTATDDDTPVADLGWSIAGGADSAMFTVSAGGDLAFASAKDFEAPDDADTDGDYEVTVRVTDGANADDAALTVRLADVDDVSPVLTDANVDGDALTLTFGEPLDGSSVPAPSAFSATVDGAARGISDVSMSGSSVTLTLASAVVSGETVTVGYAVPTGASASPLQDAAGNPVVSFSGEAVTNDTPASNTAPTGLPTISGTPQVGETLATSSAGISDADGLTNATYAWQWIANDGTSDADIRGATGAEYTLTSAEAGKTIKVRATFTDDGGTEETLVSEVTAAVNTVPTGLPMISGTAQVGETLAASASGITDGDGLSNAAFAWQWIANDGASDADIAGATGAEYTLTPAEEGKTIKVRVAFTDDGGTEETLVSDSTAAVTVALPSVSVAAVSSPVTEGTGASFTLRRTGDTTAALTVAVSVTVEGAVVSTTPASSVTFAAGSAEATLNVATVDDSVAEADARVSVAVKAGSGYLVGSGSGSAGVDVYDNDAVASAPVKTLWTSTLEWQGDYGAGWVNANEEDFSSPGWSEDGDDYRIWYIAYGSSSDELSVRTDPNMRAGEIPASEELALQVGDVTVESADAMARFARGDVATVTGIEPSWAVGEQVEVRLTRTTAGETTVTDPGVSVADAQVQEAEGAVLAFRVTLAEAQTSAVSVRYATSDGTATAGTDYEAVSGALRFAPGEVQKTVSVPVLNDAHDEGSETLTLALSRPFGAELADGDATGTIVNTDPMPKAWITRFGRTVGSQVVDAVTARFEDRGRSHVTVGGMTLGSPGPYPMEQSVWNDWETERSHGVREMTERELLLGSSFHLSSAERADGGPVFAAWGRVANDGFEGDVDDVKVEGDVTTGLLGFDAEWDRMLAGLVLSQSRGEGSYTLGGDLGNDRGTVESTLTGVYPFARLEMSERVSAWGLAGVGQGELTLQQEGETRIDTDLAMRMGAVGVKGTVLDGSGPSGVGLNVKSDAMWVRTESDNAEGLESAEGDVTRLRLIVEGERVFVAGDGATFTPTGQVGLRHDGGDAETGTGVEMGAGISYTSGALTIEGQVRTLVAHQDSGYREWGASGAIRVNPDSSGRGLSLTLAPTWGNAVSGTERLWSERDASAIAVGGEVEPEGRLEATLGYGMPLLDGRLTGTPEFGFGLSESGRDWRFGWRLGLARSGRVDFGLGVEATRREPANDDAPENRVGLTATMRW